MAHPNPGACEHRARHRGRTRSRPAPRPSRPRLRGRGRDHAALLVRGAGCAFRPPRKGTAQSWGAAWRPGGGAHRAAPGDRSRPSRHPQARRGGDDPVPALRPGHRGALPRRFRDEDRDDRSAGVEPRARRTFPVYGAPARTDGGRARGGRAQIRRVPGRGAGRHRIRIDRPGRPRPAHVHLRIDRAAEGAPARASHHARLHPDHDAGLRPGARLAGRGVLDPGRLGVGRRLARHRAPGVAARTDGGLDPASLRRGVGVRLHGPPRGHALVHDPHRAQAPRPGAGTARALEARHPGHLHRGREPARRRGAMGGR